MDLPTLKYCFSVIGMGIIRRILTMILLLMTLTINASDSQDAKRIHYGVIFKDEGQVSFSPDFWAHTIKIAPPTLIQWNKIHYCKYVDDLNCSPDEHLAREINLLRKVVLAYDYVDNFLIGSRIR